MKKPKAKPIVFVPFVGPPCRVLQREWKRTKLFHICCEQ